MSSQPWLSEEEEMTLEQLREQLRQQLQEQLPLRQWRLLRWRLQQQQQHQQQIQATYGPKFQEVKEGTIPIKLSEMNQLHFEDLPNLRSFSNGDVVEWPLLENVIVNQCAKVKKFGLGRIKNSQLKSVSLENQAEVDIDTKIVHLFDILGELSMIDEYNIDDNDQLKKAVNTIQPSHFTNLLRFSAKDCDESLNEFLSILIKRSKMLQDISIEHCKTHKYLFDLSKLTPNEDGHNKHFTKIKKLTLIELHKLRYIWSKYEVRHLDLDNMQIIHIKSCSSLVNLFPAFVAKSLHQLKELKLEICKMLNQVIDSGIDTDNDEVTDIDNNEVITDNDEVTGTDNDEVITDNDDEVIDSDDIKTIKFPVLSKVEFKSLPKLICFYINHLEFPNIKTLIVEKCPQLEQFTTGFATTNARHVIDGKCFSELNELMLDSCDKMVCVVSSNTLHELKNLKKLIVGHCKALKMLFNIHGEVSDSTKLLQQLDELIMIDLPNLTDIINKKVDRFSENLQILKVRQCKSLNWLPISVKLKNMEISQCEVLEKIMILNKEEETIRKATFSQLKSIFIENLPNLSTAFPFGSEFPSLEVLEISNCPTLITFVEDSNKQKDLSESTTSDYFFSNSVSFNLKL